MDNITSFKNESKSISVLVPSGYTSGFTMNFTLNEKEYEYTGSTLSKTGLTITDNISTVTITAVENDIEEKVYFFQCDIINGSLKYTIAKGTYTVLPTIT